LVGLMTTVGLILIGAPYAAVLGVIAGVTNIVPYLGPFIGAIPGILIMAIEPHYRDLLWPTVIIYLIANIIDFVFIFPVIVAKLVDLHPLMLIGAVVVGQQYYGLVGMLVSIPIAAALKVILQEFYTIIYQPPRRREREGLGAGAERS